MVLVRSLLERLTDVLMEKLERGLLFRSLITTEAAIDALYKSVFCRPSLPATPTCLQSAQPAALLLAALRARHYLLNLGFPEVVRSRLDSLYQSVLFHDHEAACRLLIRLLGLAKDDDRTHPRFGDDLRTLYFRAMRWIRANGVVGSSHGLSADAEAPSYTITRRKALVVCKELLSAEEYGPRFMVDLQDLTYQLRDVEVSRRAASRGRGSDRAVDL